MTVYLTLTFAGIDTGPFDLYTDLDAYSVPFITGVSKLDLQSGYTIETPDNAIIIRIKSVGTCINHVDVSLHTLECEPLQGITTRDTICDPFTGTAIEFVEN